MNFGERVSRRMGAIPFVILHLSALLAFTVPFRVELLAWCTGSYLVRMFGVTAGYHRYFSHRSYRLSRFWQFVMAVLAQTSGQKGVLWWAAHHRDHHRYSDQPNDVHSPVQDGFWWSHVGWVLAPDYDSYEPKRVTDLAQFPELRWLNRYHLVPFVAYGGALYALGGLDVFIWGFLISTVVLYHGTFLINSMAHVWGSRRFNTKDDSRNNFWLALITLGEGWHNNHHEYMSAARQGLRWWEIDLTYYGLKVLSWLGIARQLRQYPDRMRTTGKAG